LLHVFRFLDGRLDILGLFVLCIINGPGLFIVVLVVNVELPVMVVFGFRRSYNRMRRRRPFRMRGVCLLLLFPMLVVLPSDTNAFGHTAGQHFDFPSKESSRSDSWRETRKIEAMEIFHLLGEGRALNVLIGSKFIANMSRIVPNG
jgi:hypothetical protein